jgi:hypothetical protein
MVAIFRNCAREWHNLMNSGYVCDSVANDMVQAGIAEWSDSPNAKISGHAPTENT